MPNLNLFSLFTGAGGLDYGFEAAGFSTALAIEMDSDACNTVRRNRPGWGILEDDIHRVPPKRALEASGLQRAEVDAIIGGPPCQPFSKSGYWANGDTARLDDPRANTLESFLGYIEEIRPPVFVLENVHGICYAHKDEGLQMFLRRIEDINRRHGTSYLPSMAVLNAADYGVPQMRKRFFMIAHSGGKRFTFPTPTHAPHEGRREDETALPCHLTAWDAIGDLNDLPAGEELSVRSRWAGLLPTIPEGENYLYHTIRGGGRNLFGYRTRYWSFLLKLAKSRPSWTIQASPARECGPFHWKSRRLSVREMARLQTFPEGIEFTGDLASAQRQIGNAVPSLLAEVLAGEIAVQLLGEQRRPLSLALRPRRPIPEPEPLGSYPYEFIKYEGKYSDHPGEGMGPRGRQRRSGESGG